MASARERTLPLTQICRELGESCLRRWMAWADIDKGREGPSTAERDELVRLHRENRQLAMENEILKRAAAYFAKENVLPR